MRTTRTTRTTPERRADSREVPLIRGLSWVQHDALAPIGPYYEIGSDLISVLHLGTLADVPAGEDDYEGVRYEDMVFADVDWSEIGEHDPARRSERKGTTRSTCRPSGRRKPARTADAGSARRTARVDSRSRSRATQAWPASWSPS